MTGRANEAFAALLEEVDTAPEGQALDDALDDLLDFVQEHRGAILAGLAPREPEPQVVRYVDAALPVLRGYIRHLIASEGFNYIPAAVTKRGTAFIPTPVPEGMTEAQFQILLEAEAQAADNVGEETGAQGLRLDLNRRRKAFEAQARRDAQIAALAPLPGRRAWA